MCLEVLWKHASRSVLLECVEGEEYLWRGAQQLRRWTGVDPPAEDQWISVSVGADDQLGNGAWKGARYKCGIDKVHMVCGVGLGIK